MEERPSSELAASILPAPLYAALTHLFAQGIEGCALVGGTALAGYYAGHRRSDDLDLFTRDTHAQRATTLALSSLRSIGARLRREQTTPQFSAFSAALQDHRFTIQVVLDANLFAQGAMAEASDGVSVATLDTLLMQKAATLVSRAGEKDLYDLIWLFAARPALDVAELVRLGSRMDTGVSAENILMVLAMTAQSESACGFAPGESSRTVFSRIESFKVALMKGLDHVARQGKAPPLGELVRALK